MLNDKIKNLMNIKLEKLIESHWNYVKELLTVSGESERHIKLIEFHYKTAFAHGWKHAIEEIEENTL